MLNFVMINVCRHYEILCWWWCLSTLQMVLCWCLFRECSWLLSSNLRVMMSSEDQTIHEEMMSLFINVKFGADRARDMNYYFKFMFYNSFNWTYQGQRSPSRILVEDRNLLPRKSLPRRIQAVNRGDLGFTKSTGINGSSLLTASRSFC